MAKALNKPFYVVAESFKFVRMYPLNQDDLPNVEKVGDDVQREREREHNSYLSYQSLLTYCLTLTSAVLIGGLISRSSPPH